MQGPQRVVAAALYKHPGGTELRVYFEPEDRDDLLQSEVQRVDVTALEQKAEMSRDIPAREGMVAVQRDMNSIPGILRGLTGCRRRLVVGP